MRYYRQNRSVSEGLFAGLISLGCAAAAIVLSIAITAAPFLLTIWFAKELGLF